MNQTKHEHRQNRGKRVKKKIGVGTSKRPRMSVYCSNKSISVQMIDDTTSKTLVSSDSLKEKNGGNIDSAKKIGSQISKLAKERKISSIVFDRGGHAYHGRVKALADAAREGGLQF